MSAAILPPCKGGSERFSRAGGCFFENPLIQAKAAE
jgi:hypothetical protein